MKLLILLLTVSFLAGCTAQTCNKRLQDLPSVRGLRLGMTIAQVKGVLPEFKEATKNKYGASLVIFQQVPAAEDEIHLGYLMEGEKVEPQWIGIGEGEALASIKRMQLGFVDDRLANITIYYLDDLEWKTADEFAQQIAKQFNLENHLRKTSKSYSCICLYFEPPVKEGFLIDVGIEALPQSGKEYPYLKLENPMLTMQPRSRARDDAETKKREFKP